MILAAPDSFKGTFTAAEVAGAMGRGIRAAGAEPELLPAADGGEGTIAAMLAVHGGERRTFQVHDPLGREIEAEAAILEGGRDAVVEAAAASGLGLVPESERDAERASSYGTGELIAAVASEGVKRVMVAAGGSATTDGGAGAIEAIEEAGGLGDAKLEVVCDTVVPFERAAEVFGPQKGADPAAVARLTDRLVARAGALPRDPRGRAMTGAGGGLSGGLWAAFGARLVPGAAYVLGALGFDRRLEAATAVLTGEGRLDATSLDGKLVGEIAKRCARNGVPCHVISGSVDLDDADAAKLGATSVCEAPSLRRIEDAAAALPLG